MIKVFKAFLLVLFGLLGIVDSAYASTDIRLYTLNCGTINVHDGDSFSDTGFYKHKPLVLSDPCYLIKHDDQWLLWDLGLGDKYLGHEVENKTYRVGLSVPVSLPDQLKQIGLVPRDIKYVAISHAHFDHIGNMDLFPQATLLIRRAEYSSVQQDPLPPGIEKGEFQIMRKMHKELVSGNYDVFKDGSVLMLSTPGHTPGHQSLEIKLPHSGVVILSGDLYHTQDAYRHKLVPVENANRADTLASMARIEGILDNTGGRLIIQHDLDDFNSLPRFPQYLN